MVAAKLVFGNLRLELLNACLNARSLPSPQLGLRGADSDVSSGREHEFRNSTYLKLTILKGKVSVSSSGYTDSQQEHCPGAADGGSGNTDRYFIGRHPWPQYNRARKLSPSRSLDV